MTFEKWIEGHRQAGVGDTLQNPDTKRNEENYKHKHLEHFLFAKLCITLAAASSKR